MFLVYICLNFIVILGIEILSFMKLPAAKLLTTKIRRQLVIERFASIRQVSIKSYVLGTNPMGNTIRELMRKYQWYLYTITYVCIEGRKVE